jgi:hypothetical protein
MTLKIAVVILFLLTSPAAVFALPVPKEGLLISKDAVDEIRARVAALGDHPWMNRSESEQRKPSEIGQTPE